MVKETNYGITARRFRQLGYNVFPAEAGKKHPCVYWGEWQEKLLDEDTIATWEQKFPEADPVFLTGYCCGHKHNALYVVDVDDPDLLDWAIEVFGDTPLRVASGREGGGVHLYYREQSGAQSSVIGRMGPGTAIRMKEMANGKIRYSTKIDIKGSKGVVVAPGATHKSGRTYSYLPGAPESLTADWIQKNVPLLRVDTIREEEQKFLQLTNKHHVRGTVPAPVEVSSEFDSLEIATERGGKVSWVDLVASRKSQSIYCPFCEDSTSPSAMFYYNDGHPAIQCFTVCDTQYRPISSFTNIGQEFLELMDRMGREVEHLYLSPVNGYAPPLPEHRIVINRYPMGWGKTHTAREEARKYTTSYLDDQGKECIERHIVAIGPTQALCAKLAEDFEVLSYAEAANHEISDAGVAVCVPSVCRVTLEGRQDFVLIIDEADQIFDMIHEKKVMKDPRNGHRNTVEVWEHMSWLMQNAKKVIIADAFGSERLVREIERMMKHQWDPSEVAIVSPPPTLKPLAEHTEVRVGTEGELLAQILLTANQGKKGVVSCDTLTGVRTIAYALRERHPELRIWEVSGDTPKAQKDNLRTATQYIKENYDWVIHNQAAGSGVSLEMPGWTSFVYGFVHPGTNGPQLRQLSGRLRHPEGNLRYSHVRKMVNPANTDYLEYLPTQTEIKQQESLHIRRIHDGEVVSVRTHERVLQSRGDCEWYQNAFSLDCHTWYYDTLIREGATVVDYNGVSPAAIPKLREFWKEIRERAEAHARGEKWAAPKIHRKAADIDPQTPEEAAMVARHWIINYWGIEGLHEALIGDYGRDILREKAERFNDVRLLASDNGSLLLKHSQRPAVVNGKLIEAELSPRYSIAESLLKTLRVLDLDPLNFTGDTLWHQQQFSEEQLQEVLSIYTSARMKATLGLNTPPKNVKSLVQYTNRILGLLGLNTKAVKRTVDGKRIRCYAFDEEYLTLWLSATQRPLDKAMGKELAPVVDIDNNPSYRNICGDWDSLCTWGNHEIQENLVANILAFRREQGPFCPLPHQIQEDIDLYTLDIDSLIASITH